MTEVPKLYQDWNYEGTTVAFEDWQADPQKVLDVAQDEDIGIVLDNETTVYLVEKSRYIQLFEKTDFPDWYHDLSQAPRPTMIEMMSPDWLRVLLPDDSTGAVIRESGGRETVLLREWWFWRIEHVGGYRYREAKLVSADVLEAMREGLTSLIQELEGRIVAEDDDIQTPGM
ncbi:MULTISPECIES: hypothetical protein [unclassified Pannonibacter]|uniref:hypothetical protein n=1 Tax=unclassified Pannonibacter TaxID=2627228 RepID=UPI0016443BC5|nr:MULTISPECIES: hypothetical protein [unclassified Pannonibacter]